jgi:hypothetical protein
MLSFAPASPEGSTEAVNDELQALEERVLRTVEVVKLEREMRAAAEQRAISSEQQCREREVTLERVETELLAYKQERDEIRQRMERLLRQLDTLAL